MVHFEDLGGAMQGMWAQVASTDQRELEKMTQRWDAMQRRIGDTWSGVEVAVQSAILNIMEGGTDWAEQSAADFELLKNQAKGFQDILARGMEIGEQEELDPVKAGAYFESVRENLDKIKSISPTIGADVEGFQGLTLRQGDFADRAAVEGGPQLPPVGAIIGAEEEPAVHLA